MHHRSLCCKGTRRGYRFECERDADAALSRRRRSRHTGSATDVQSTVIPPHMLATHCFALTVLRHGFFVLHQGGSSTSRKGLPS